MKKNVRSLCHGAVETAILGVNGTKWAPRRAVSGSPLSYSLLLASGELFLSVINIFAQLMLRPKIFEEASEDAKNDEPSVKHPGYVNVSLLAFIVGFVGICWKYFVVHMAQRHYRVPCIMSNTLNLYTCQRTGAVMWIMWVFFSTAVMHVLGVPLEQIGSSVLCGVVYASVGFSTPYANAVVEAIRSEWLHRVESYETQHPFETERKPSSSSVIEQSQTQYAAKRQGTLWEKHQPDDMASAPPAHAPLEQEQQPPCVLLSLLDICFWPVVIVPSLVRRACLNSTYKERFHREDLGNLLLFFSVFPLMSAVFFSFIACIFFPMDWPTVYVQFPIPLVIGLSVSYFVSSGVGALALLLLPTCTVLADARGHASPVLQRLMLAIK